MWWACGSGPRGQGCRASGCPHPHLRCQRRAGCEWPRAEARSVGPRPPLGPAAARGPPWPPGPRGCGRHPRRPALRSWPSGAGGRGPAPGEATQPCPSPSTPVCLGFLADGASPPSPRPRAGPAGRAGQLTLSGEPVATLARPRSTSRRTLAQLSFCRAARLSSSDSKSIRSLTTLLLSSWGQRGPEHPPAGLGLNLSLPTPEPRAATVQGHGEPDGQGGALQASRERTWEGGVAEGAGQWLWPAGKASRCLARPWSGCRARGSYLGQESCGGDPLDVVHAALRAEQRLRHQGQPGAGELCHGAGEEATLSRSRSGPSRFPKPAWHCQEFSLPPSCQALHTPLPAHLTWPLRGSPQPQAIEPKGHPCLHGLHARPGQPLLVLGPPEP